MRAADTNSIVRLIAHDDPKQLASAREFVAPGAWVSHVVLAEVVWVLASVYERNASAIAATIDVLLHHEHLTLQDGDVVAATLARFRNRPAAGFTHCLALEIARKAGHLPLGTFDRDLSKLDGAQRL
jgi:predicted nucleic-acid-binding protein